MYTYMLTHVLMLIIRKLTGNSPNKKKAPLKFYALLSCPIYMVMLLRFFSTILIFEEGYHSTKIQKVKGVERIISGLLGWKFAS